METYSMPIVTHSRDTRPDTFPGHAPTNSNAPSRPVRIEKQYSHNEPAELTAAIEYAAAGLSVVFVRGKGSKQAAYKWGEFEDRIATEEELRRLYRPGNGVAIVAGSISGNLEILDLDLTSYEAFQIRAEELGCGDLLESLSRYTTGSHQGVNSGGVQIVYRCESLVPGSEKLAERQIFVTAGTQGARQDAGGRWYTLETMIETRGEGAYGVCPPSGPTVHKDGNPYVMVNGDLTNIPVITEAERNALIDAARSFNEYEPPKPPVRTPSPSTRSTNGGLSPCDDYNERGDVVSLLESDGCTFLYQRGDEVSLCRPGKRGKVSMTFNKNGYRNLKVYTSNFPPFEQNDCFKPSTVFAKLKHNKDFSAATKALAALGYGSRTPQPAPTYSTTQKPIRTASVAQEQPAPEVASAIESPGVDSSVSDEQAARPLPTIETNNRSLSDMSNDAFDALVKANDPPQFYQQNGKPVRVLVDENNRARISGISGVVMRGTLDRVANFVSTSEKRGSIPVYPPKPVTEDVLEMGNWLSVPPLTGIVTSPVVSKSGKLLIRPGYHPDARLYYHSEDALVIPDTTPTPASVRAARQLLTDDLLGDFPFKDEASRAHAMSLIIAPFVRPCIGGPTPVHNIDAPTAGTGKTLIATASVSVFSPRGAEVRTLPSDEAEMSKTLTSAFKSGASHIFFDNVQTLASGKLNAAITSETWTDRLMGGNENITVENRVVWIVTANNLHGNAETNRRSVWIRLDAGAANPERREGFRHPELIAWIKDNRAALVGAVLTLVRAWLEKGRPAYSGKEKPVGGFEAWTQVMGGILETAGIPGFLENRTRQSQHMNKEATDMAAFVAQWHEGHAESAVSAKELLPVASEWLSDRIEADTEKAKTVRLGKLLNHHIDQIHGGWKMVSAGIGKSGGHKNVTLFRLESTENGRGVGVVGVLQASPREYTEQCNNILPIDGGENPYDPYDPYQSTDNAVLDEDEELEVWI